MNIIVRWIIATLAIMLLAHFLPGVTVRNYVIAMIVAVVLGIVNISIRPLLRLLTLPINLPTLGVFNFVINTLMILLVSSLAAGFQVRDIWWALGFSLLLSVAMSILDTTQKN